MKRTGRKTEEQARTSGPTHDQIAQHAYEIFVARGESDGQDVEDWLRAEAALQAAGESNR
jgi:hypothetical protein